MKRQLKELIRYLGYEVRRVEPLPTDADSLAARTVKNAEHYSKWNSSVPLLMPWLEDNRFLALYEVVKGSTIVSIDRCYIVYCMARYSSVLSGDFAECGVYKGGTARLLCELAIHKQRVHLFDAFSGLPAPDQKVDNFYKEGTFSDTSIELVRNLLAHHVERADIHDGWMPQSFEAIKNNMFSFVHVDVDLYQTARACCEFFFPRLIKGGVILFDDYGFPACRGEKEAVDEFFSDKAEKPICIPTGQALIIRQ